jgi:2Fe-2S ferredoxin
MEGAREASLRGIVAELGGACATCHVFVAPDWAAKMPPIEEMENDMLDFVESQGSAPA